MKRQAKTGGEIGANGEFYKGGQFIAESEKTIKGNGRKHYTGKQEVAVYKWEVAPNADVRPIWGFISGMVRFEGKTGYSKELGKTGTLVLVDVEILANNYYGDDFDGYLAKMQDLVNRWNNGERWYQKEDWYKGK